MKATSHQIPARAFTAAHLRALADGLDWAVMVLSETFKVQLWNRWLEEHTGLTSADVKGKSVFELLPQLATTGLAEQLQLSVFTHDQGFEWHAPNPLLIPINNSLAATVETLTCRPLKHAVKTAVWIDIVCQQPNQQAQTDISLMVTSELSAEQFPARLSSSALGLVQVDSFGFIVRINHAMLSRLGFDDQDVVDKPLRLLFPQLSEDVADTACRKRIEAAVKQSATNSLQAVTVDGGVIDVALFIFDSLENPEHLILCCQEAEPPLVVQTALQRQRELLTAVFDHVVDGILIVNPQGYLQEANPVASEMLSLGHRRQTNTHINDVLRLSNSQGEVISPISEAIHREQTVTLAHDIYLSLGDTSTLAITLSVTPVHEHDRSLAGAVVVMRAISESRRISTKLGWHESHDPLTQLANRSQIEREIALAIDHAHSEDINHGVFYLDLYNFSIINDTSGHAAGDEVLRQFAQLLCRSLDDYDVVGRAGNDEFAILLWQKSGEKLQQAAEHILAKAADFSLNWKGRRLKVGVSIGVEMITANSRSAVDVMLAARASCANAREQGRNRICFPNKDKAVSQQHNLSRWVARITDALEEDRFVVYCQPIVGVQDNQSIKHYEALVRMVDEDGKVVAPGHFIPAAESSGLIDDIDRWVFDKIIETLESLPSQHRNQLSFAVNLSGYTLSDERFLDYVVARLQNLDLKPGTLQFEITETSAVKHFDRAVTFINSLSALGCKFALDDFGSGLSSFGYLKKLPVDYVKIDGSFVSKIETDGVEHSMVSAINHLAHVMGLVTIAEAIETDAQLRILQEMGVDYGQGYFFAVPEPLDNIVGRLV